MRRRISVVTSIGVPLLLLAVWVFSRTTFKRQSAAGEKPLSAGQTLPGQQKILAGAQTPSAQVSAWAILLQVLPRLVDPDAANSVGATFRDLTLIDFAV